MNRHTKHILGLTVFAAVCMALGMGLGHTWTAGAQEHQPVSVSAKAADQLPPIVEIAEKLNPTVVSIENSAYVRNSRNMSPFGDPFGDPFEYFFREPRQNRQREEREERRRLGGGSGFFISHDGEILTNAHVIEAPRGSSDPKITVKTVDGKEYVAEILGKDTDLDIALLKIKTQNAPYAKLGDSDSTKVGEWVVAIGNPLGLEHTVTQGIISAKGRSSYSVSGDPNAWVGGFLQTDAAINRGNSGGPLFNLRGEAVGINNSIRADGQNIGFAVPISPVKKVLNELRTGKPLNRGWLGVSTGDLDKDFGEGLGISQGAMVSSVTKDSPAEKAGVKPLDVIVSVDGQPIKTSNELVESIASRREGDAVKLEIVRGGKRQTLIVTLGNRASLSDDDSLSGGRRREEAPNKESAGTVDLGKTYGFEVGALDDQTRRTHRIPDSISGVAITKVLPRTSASDKGLSEGIVIVAVGTKEIKNLADFRAEAQKIGGKTIILSIRIRTGTSGNGFSEPTFVAIPPMQGK
ncbi:MAG: trypsin-like peptidase domain-containing protein [Holophagales bacterium]|nr:trypsin-like peptidase domain-containing protein [Holophagales bacterium]